MTSGVGNIAVVGSGKHLPTGWTTARSVLDLQSVPGCILTATVEPDPTRWTESEAALGVPTDAVFATVAEMLAARRQGTLRVDGVFVFSSPEEHLAQAMACLREGLHVLVKEPLVVSTAERDGPADAAALAAAAAEAGVTLMVVAPLSYAGACEQASHLVEAGRLGVVEHIVCHCEGPLRDLDDDQPLTLQNPPNSSAALADTTNPAGYAWGQLPHLLSWVLRVSGAKPEACYAVLGSNARGVDAYDSATVRCGGGVSLVISGAGTAPNRGRLGDFQARVFGSQGVLEFSNGAGWASEHGHATLSLRRHDGADLSFSAAELSGSSTSAKTPPDKHDDGSTATQSFRTFVEICRGETDVFVGAGAAVSSRVVEVIDAMHRSAASGLPERIGPEHAPRL